MNDKKIFKDLQRKVHADKIRPGCVRAGHTVTASQKLSGHDPIPYPYG